MATDYAKEISVITQMVEQMVPSAVVELIHFLGVHVEKVLPYPYGYEVVGISKVANVSAEDLLLANLVYELTAYNRTTKAKACTSIVARAENSTLFHGRNMDYGSSIPGMTEVLQNLTFIADFQDNGETIYTGTTFAGFVGLPSGQKPKQFTITVNERDEGDLWMNAVEALIAGTHGTVSLLIRDVLADPEMDFKMASERLITAPLITSSYIIVGGVEPNEGVVITRGRSSAKDVWWLGSNGSWFLVETNYDHWTAPPSSDDRRDPAIKGMREMGQSRVGTPGLFTVFSTPPVLNDGTTHTVIMSAAYPELYSSWVRHYHGN